MSHVLFSRETLSEDAMGGGRKRGEENVISKTPPRRWFSTPHRLVRFPLPSGGVAAQKSFP